MFGDLWRLAVDLQPGERLWENRSLHERLLRARAGVDVVQSSLHRQQMVEMFDVAAPERELAQSWDRRLTLSRVLGVAWHRTSTDRRLAERQQEAAK